MNLENVSKVASTTSDIRKSGGFFGRSTAEPPEEDDDELEAVFRKAEQSISPEVIADWWRIQKTKRECV